MGYKLVEYIKILRKKDKVVLCNGETGGWIRLTNEIFEIIKMILNGQLDIDNSKDKFESDDDYNYIKNLYLQLIKQKFIILQNIKFKNIMVSLEMTHRCNLKCKHCCVDAEDPFFKGVELTTKEIKEIFNKFINWNPISILLSGGEALLRDDFFILLEYLRKNYTGKIIVSTNGTLITKENVSKLCKWCDKLDISIDGIDEKTTSLIRGKGVFNKVLEAVTLIKSTGFKKIALSMVFSDKNENLKGEFLSLNKRLGTKPVIRAFAPVGRGEKFREDLTNTPINEAHISKDYLSSNYNKEIKCCTCVAGKREIYVDYKGDIYPCPDYIIEECKLGNILDIDKLEEVIDTNRINRVSDKVANIDQRYKLLCRDCCVNEFCWTCPGEALTLKSEEAIKYKCKLVKEVLEKRVWGQ